MIRGIWTRETVSLVILASAIPVAVAWLWSEGVPGASRLAYAVVLGGLWQAVFTVLRAQPPSATGLVAALVIAMIAPDVGPFQLALGVSFGFVFGELVFGGWGRSVLSPAVVAVVFLGFGFPVADWPTLSVTVGWATMPAAVILLIFGILPWRALVGAFAVLLVGGGFSLGLITSAVGLALVFLVCDPAIAPSTPLGRWLYGGLFGALVTLFAALWGASATQMAVSAALLASLAAPLLDEIAVAFWRALRRQRHG